MNIFVKSENIEYSLVDDFVYDTITINEKTTCSRTIKENPILFAGIEVTNMCNLDCSYCLVNNSIDDDYFKVTAIKNMISYLHYYHGLSRLNITGGEPFMSKYVFDILDYIENLNIDFRINTNGLLLTEKRIAKLKSYHNLHEIEISLNHPYNDSFLYKSPNNTVLRRIEKIKALKSSGIKVIVSSIITDNLLDTLFDMLKLLEEIGVNTWRLRELMAYSETHLFANFNKKIIQSLERLSEKKTNIHIYGYLYDYIKERKIKHRCKYLESNYLLAKYSGDVQWICGLDLFAGNHYENTLLDIVNKIHYYQKSINIPERCHYNCANKFLCLSSPFSKIKIDEKQQ